MYLNGVNIDGVKDKQFKNCTVQIDAKGNIHITAKGYAVRKPGGGKAAAGDAAISGRVWLVTEKAAVGMSQYDIDLYVNGKWIRKFLDEEQQVVMELTKYLKSGTNTLSFVAKKTLGNKRRSSSPQHYFRIVVGQGDSGGRNVMITDKLIDYKRTALETKNFKNDFTLEMQ